MPEGWDFHEKKAFGMNSKGFLYDYFYRELIQHHKRSERKSLYFLLDIIYYCVAGKTLKNGVLFNGHYLSPRSE